MGSQDLEEFDMFTSSPGWRLTGEAVNYLAQKNYVVDILTIEAKEALELKEKAERAEKQKLEQLTHTKNDGDYRAEVADFDALMNISFHAQRSGEYVGDFIKRISNRNNEHVEYTEYSFLSDDSNRVFKFAKHDSDSWMSQVSDEAPRNLKELQKLAADVKQKQADEIKQRQEAHQNEPLTELRCMKCGRIVYLESKKATVTKYCGKHGAKTEAECRRVGAVFEKMCELKRMEKPAGAEVIY